MSSPASSRIAAEIGDHPVLVPVSGGVLGAVVSEPAGPARAGVVLLGGRNGNRYGPNQVFTRLSRQLAVAGLTVFRCGYTDTADSWFTRSGADEDLRALREGLRWFRTRIGRLPLLAVGSCYGASLALPLTADEPDVVAVQLIAPAVWVPRPGPWYRRRSARSVEPKAGPPGPEGFTLLAALAEPLYALARRARVHLLVGEHDRFRILAEALGRDRAEAGTPIGVEVVPALALHGHSSEAAQEATIRRTAAWAATVVASLDGT